MRRMLVAVLAGCVAVGAFAKQETKELVLKPAKDTFLRSNYQIRSSGGSPSLYIANRPRMLRVLIAFDLSEVTNKILKAELRFHQQDSNAQPITLVVAPMVATERNAAWGEGRGNLGVRGQNSQPGDACYLRSAYPDTPWESASGTPLKTVADSALWESPIATLRRLRWEQQWVTIPLSASDLEKARKSKIKIVTFGFWGTAGNGYYAIGSKESGYPAELRLTVEKEVSEK